MLQVDCIFVAVKLAFDNVNWDDFFEILKSEPPPPTSTYIISEHILTIEQFRSMWICKIFRGVS